MSLDKVNVLGALAQVEQPFTLVEVAHVEALVMYAYICQGAVQWHKHIDHDELFLVQQGWIVLESEWGNITLKPDEMAVVPKGVGHRSGSQLRAVVLLLQPAVAADRKNGHRRIFAIPGENELQKFKLMDAAVQAAPFRPEPVTNIEEMAVQVVIGKGLSPEYVNQLSDSLWLVLSGAAQMQAGGESVEMETGELVVIGQGVPHRWTCSTASILFLLSRWAEGA
jgi:mannose-6-phosphate isomerase-like protein (cupin superfamily)